MKHDRQLRHYGLSILASLTRSHYYRLYGTCIIHEPRVNSDTIRKSARIYLYSLQYDTANLREKLRRDAVS